jgi:sRNA-binding protein
MWKSFSNVPVMEVKELYTQSWKYLLGLKHGASKMFKQSNIHCLAI